MDSFAIEVPNNLSDKQQINLNKAYEIAKADGHKDPEILQGIILQESNAGALKSYNVAGQEFGLKPFERYYGLAQIKLAAAKDVLKSFPMLYTKYDIQTKTDDEIVANLILKDEFNIEVASKYLRILKDQYGIKSYNTLLIAYNRGPGGIKADEDTASVDYVKGVKSKLNGKTNP